MRAFLAIALVAAACGGSSSPTTIAPIHTVPLRAPTAGDALLARLPAGADVVVELDLARLRANDAVGALARDLLADSSAAGAAAELPFVGAVGTPALARAETIVLASYRVGTAQASTITLLRGDGLTADEVAGTDVGGGVIAVAPPDALAELGVGPGLDADEELRMLRARAMPAKATGAVLRITARLGFDARVALASQLELDAAPATLSLWADVADDVALIADVDAPDQGGGAVGDELGVAVATLIEAWRDEVARRAEIVALGLRPSVEAIEISPRGESVRIVALVGPRRLSRVVRRARIFVLTKESP